MFTFGKHKGKTFEDVYEADPSYCSWALKQAKPNSKSMREFLVFLKTKEPLDDEIIETTFESIEHAEIFYINNHKFLKKLTYKYNEYKVLPSWVYETEIEFYFTNKVSKNIFIFELFESSEDREIYLNQKEQDVLFEQQDCPSKIKHKSYLYFFDEPIFSNVSGKWILTIHIHQLDELWKKCKCLPQIKLGASTGQFGGTDSYLMFYTTDHRNIYDVFKLGVLIKEFLNIQEVMYYIPSYSLSINQYIYKLIDDKLIDKKDNIYTF